MNKKNVTFCLLLSILLVSCGMGNVYVLDNNSSKKQNILVQYKVNENSYYEVYSPPDSLYVTTNPNFSTKTHKWNKNAEYRIPYTKIDELTYQLELAEQEKVFIPYRYRLNNSIDKIVIGNEQEITFTDEPINDSLHYFKGKNLKPKTRVHYESKLFADSFYLVEIE